MMTTQRPYIFLSHSRQNLPHRDSFIERLTNAGFTLWYDERDIEPGSRWTKSIENAIKNCAAVVLIHSAESVQSRWIERETLYADELEKPIMMAQMDETPIPFSMKELQAIPFHTHPDAGFERLIKALNKISTLKNPEKAIEKQKKALRDHRFFKHLKKLPDGELCAQTALDLLAWAEANVDEISFTGNKEPALSAVLWIGNGGLSVFRVRAYPRQPSIEIPFGDLAAFAPYDQLAERLRVLRRLNFLMPAGEEFEEARADRRPNLPIARALATPEALADFKQLLDTMVAQLRARDSVEG